jgi:serine/threonine-protein kinase
MRSPSDAAASFNIDETLVATEGSGPATSAEVSRPGASSLAPGSGERQVLARRYEIEALLGAGGMGTVYRARDLELDEVVALKVLRREVSEAPGILERFRREVKLARRVTHHHVARVFDIGEHEGEKFLTMELVDGEPLSSTLGRGAPPLARAVAIARAVADGVASAHAAGVVHRDLKPDNVLLAADGRVVVTDFGIARAAADVAGASQTLGTFLGTPAYMAPEQVEGRADVDARADVYAFGALLFELFTGARAWPGESPFAVASARLNTPPPDPRRVRPDLPDAHADLVLRCLARRPEDRPASMAEVAAALASLAEATAHGAANRTAAARSEAPRTQASPTPVDLRAFAPAAHEAPARADKTVAVLPFRNGGAPEDDYLAEELTDDLIDALSMTRGLKVRSRGMVARYRGAELDPREIGRELGVTVVVDGSVRRARGNVRIAARLVSVTDGFQLWAKRFDRREQDVLSINDEVARAIAAALTVDCAGGREAPSDPVALDLYIRGRHEYRQYWPEPTARALDLFQQALARAPEDPGIRSWLALALVRRAFFSGGGNFAEARRLAEEALAAAPGLGEARLALGVVHFHTGEPAAAARALVQAIARSPGLADAHVALGRILVEANAPEDGMRRLEAGLALDPDSANARQDIGRTLALLGRWDEADAVLEKLRERDDVFSYWTLRARIALWRRHPDAAEQYMHKLGEDRRAGGLPALMLGIAKGTVQREQAAARFEELASGAPARGRRRAFFLQLRAEILASLGAVDDVLHTLDLAIDAGLIDQVWVERCPLLEDVRRAPGYARIHAALVQRSEEILAAYREG